MYTIVSVTIGVLGGLVGGRRAYYDQFRGFEYHRVHVRECFFLHHNWSAESVRA